MLAPAQWIYLDKKITELYTSGRKILFSYSYYYTHIVPTRPIFFNVSRTMTCLFGNCGSYKFAPKLVPFVGHCFLLYHEGDDLQHESWLQCETKSNITSCRDLVTVLLVEVLLMLFLAWNVVQHAWNSCKQSVMWYFHLLIDSWGVASVLTKGFSVT